MDALIAARGLHAYYGSSHVLRGVDFHIGSGETVGLLGRNGMGKTTLLRSLLGHVKPKRGEVRVRGSDMTGAAPEAVARCGVAYVPEGRGIFPNLTVRENLIMAARRASDGGRGWTLERVLEVFPRLGERLAHRGDALSGGEQQMLALGRALLTNPRALLLDEATEGLAPLLAREIWRVIGALSEDGVATVVVDRNVGAVLDHADRCVVLVKGEVVADAASAELRSRPELLHRHLGV
ncbi:MAG TPA: ABC transporter ATP-binding protein [Casimicrobiaceae bacterium]|nr:ABC transporter ATP-binding protein [Casimicrobiaceae bacterium]